MCWAPDLHSQAEQQEPEPGAVAAALEEHRAEDGSVATGTSYRVGVRMAEVHTAAKAILAPERRVTVVLAPE